MLPEPVQPEPTAHLRSYPVGNKTIAPAGKHMDGMFLFDSLTAARFDDWTVYDKWMAALGDQSKLERAKADEGAFTEFHRRVRHVQRLQ